RLSRSSWRTDRAPFRRSTSRHRKTLLNQPEAGRDALVASSHRGGDSPGDPRRRRGPRAERLGGLGGRADLPGARAGAAWRGPLPGTRRSVEARGEGQEMKGTEDSPEAGVISRTRGTDSSV